MNSHSEPSMMLDPQTPPQKSQPLSSSTPHILQTPVNPPPKVTSKTCLPRPLFHEEPETFSTKKERREGGLFRPPPRPPAKSCPPKSRVFRHRNLLKAQMVSFNDTSDKHASVTETPLNCLNSSVYDEKKKESFFEQAFSIERKLGAGYFGTVYKVKSQEDNKFYAVKIAKEMYKGQSDRSRKLEEVRKHQFLPPHSNLVKFYNSWEDRGRLYQQFELCKGNLQDLGYKEGRLAETVIWGYMVDLLKALQHLHEHDLVHMDIKPENIFIGMDGICKLGDFGLMIDMAKGESEAAMEGDPCYLAQEVLQGKFSKACDIFSLGVTLLELATDMDPPKGGPLWHDLRNKGPDPSLTIHLQPELRRVIQLMMSKDPERRPGVKQLLELPSVSQAVKTRERQLMLARTKEVIMSFVSLFIPLLSLLFAFITSIIHPVKKFLSQLHHYSPPSTPPPFLASSQASSSQNMDCFSDDETELTLSSSGSSLAVPLDSSSSERLSMSRLTSTPQVVSPQFFSPDISSNEAVHHSLVDSYCFSPMRRPATSPGPLRARARFMARTPGGVSPGKRLFFGSNGDSGHVVKTPVSTSRRASDSPDLAHTPANRGEDDHDDNDEVIRNHGDDSDEDLVPMKPKSLAATFDCFSDED